MDFKAFKQKMLGQGLTDEEFEKYLYDYAFGNLNEGDLDTETLDIFEKETYEAGQVESGYEAKEFGFYKKGKNDSKIPLYYPMAYYMRDDLGCICKDKYIWIFNGKHYEYCSYEMLQSMVTELTHDQASPPHLNGFCKIILAKNQTTKTLVQPEGFINLNNGILNIKTRELIPHSKDYFFKYCLPINYSPEAKAPRFLRYLDETFFGNVDLAKLTFQIYGYCLLGGDPFLHKAFVLYGNGRNGKSVWLHALKGLMGKQNYCTVSIGLLNRPFSVVQMDGKLANIVGELTNGIIDSESFKTAVGGEELTAAYKGKDEFSLKIDSRLLFATNHLPVFKDTTAGMYEKLCIIPFNRYLKPSERDPGIFKEISNELSGILNYALDGLSEVLENRSLADVKEVHNTLEEYREDSDIAYKWIKEYIQITDNKNDHIATSVIYDIFKNDTENEHKFQISQKSFGQRILQHLKNNTSLQGNVDFNWRGELLGKRRRGFCYVRYNQNGQD